MRYAVWKPALGLAVATAMLGAPTPSRAQNPNPYMQLDDSWINIEGQVDRVWEDSFTLDYGDGVVTVEMDDGDRDADAYVLRRGDKVAVSGRVDDDLFEFTTIEAGRVYVESLDTNFYSSTTDEEDWLVGNNPALDTFSTEIRGRVTSVGETSFTMRVGTQDVTVHTWELGYDPLDDEGYQRIERGDYVAVTARLQSRFFVGHEVVADRVTTLYDRTLS